MADTYRLPTDSAPPIEGLLAAYSQMMENPDTEVRSRAAAEWVAWEDAVISQEVNGSPGACTPWEIARAWPEAELIIIEDSGHTGSTAMTEEVHAASGRLYEQITNPD